jgi:Outer membrane protein beta-barrel domain
MKRLISFAFILLAFATEAQVRVGIEAGTQLTILRIRPSQALSFSSAFTPAGGISIQIPSSTFDHIVESPLGNAFILETGLHFSNFKYQNTNIQAYDKPTGNDLGNIKEHNLTYLYIPINYLRKFKAGKARFVLGGGFFGAFNIAERISLEQPFNANNATVIGTKGANKIIGGLTTALGFEAKKIYSNLSFQRIMTNLFQRENKNQSWKGYIISLQLGYFIR